MDCPYHNLPKTNWWRESVSKVCYTDLLPFSTPTPIINRDSKIASAGSCFAQHVARELSCRGFNYLVTETAPSAFSEETARLYNYGTFTARYGNIYTPLQFLQLIQRSLGKFTPANQFWKDSQGRVYDLLRPRIAPKGFASEYELQADVDCHLAKVRLMIEQADVLVFTLGLTEAWRATVDGTVFPTCPGCSSPGCFSPNDYYFQNFNVSESFDHLKGVIELMRLSNPKLRIVLTVSPVPLAATMASRHVLEASVYSKSVLRVVAEMVRESLENVHYFPSYEIITHAGNTSDFFEQDRRSVTMAGVQAAMKCFHRQFTSDEGGGAAVELKPNAEAQISENENKTVCDEDEFYRALATYKQ